jgi:hypothetical protein
MSFQGVSNPLGPSPATILVNDYVMRTVMAKMGYQFNLKDLSQFDALYLMECHRHYTKFEQDQRDAQLKKSEMRRR